MCEGVNATLNSIEPYPTKNIIKTHDTNKSKQHKTNIIHDELTIVKNTQTNNNKFFCEHCEYYTSKKSSFNKHLYSNKHTRISDMENIAQQSCSDKLTCKVCGKKYKARNSLWYHSQKCLDKKEGIPDERKTLTSLVLELMKNNSELHKQLVDVICEGRR